MRLPSVSQVDLAQLNVFIQTKCYATKTTRKFYEDYTVRKKTYLMCRVCVLLHRNSSLI